MVRTDNEIYDKLNRKPTDFNGLQPWEYAKSFIEFIEEAESHYNVKIHHGQLVPNVMKYPNDKRGAGYKKYLADRVFSNKNSLLNKNKELMDIPRANLKHSKNHVNIQVNDPEKAQSLFKGVLKNFKKVNREFHYLNIPKPELSGPFKGSNYAETH